MFTLAVRLAKATRVMGDPLRGEVRFPGAMPATADGCSSSPGPEVKRWAGPVIGQVVGSIETRQRLVLSRSTPENKMRLPSANHSAAIGGAPVNPCRCKAGSAPVATGGPLSKEATHQSTNSWGIGAGSRRPRNRICLPSGGQTGQAALENSGWNCGGGRPEGRDAKSMAEPGAESS